jgi:hypothetical protein
MLNTILIGGSVVTAVAILFACLFVHYFGRSWNGDFFGGDTATRKRK